jgi:5-methylcytosine-specific restriction enzyme subunit McrC
MINLFEYQNSVPFPEKHFEDLEMFLDDIWNKREKSAYYTDEEDNRVEAQRFIQFLHQSGDVKSNKYVGVIHFEGHTINLLPKIFYDGSKTYDEPSVKVINMHVLWWLSYCTKLKFPNYLSGLNSESCDFFEILIYLFSKYTKELLNSSVYQKYIEVQNELNNVRGRIDFNTYINDNLATGRHHKVSCVYDSFEMDNEFNQCVKYVSRLLVSTSKNPDSIRNLNEIIFLLDEVTDIAVSADTCRKITFNAMFNGFETVRDYCLLFLENSISFNYKNSLKLFAFLLPMEYVFEDFIHGFINSEVTGVTSKKQDSTTHLDNSRNFLLKPDLLLHVGTRNYIADAKYKIVYNDVKDKKHGISQNDLYQMVAYAIRFNIPDVKLFYPETIHSKINQSKGCIVIDDELAGGEKINIETHQLKIIGDTVTSEESSLSLFEHFSGLKAELKEHLEGILKV